MIVFLSFLACSPIADQRARKIYNQAVEQLRSQDLDAAKEAFLEARDQAGTDAVLRQQAAYNLALSHAISATQKEGEDPQAALEGYGTASSWFRDAVRLNPDDADARVNLEVVLKRMQMLTDQLNQGQNSLQARLQRVLEDNRSLRDKGRGLANQIALAGDSRDPTSFRSQFDGTAVEVRALQAETSLILQLSAAERAQIEGVAEEERSQEQQMRQVQLAGLEHHLSKGRDDISDARRVLRKLDISTALERLEASVRHIKRAAEQLEEPLAVLQRLAQEQQQLGQQSVTLLLSDKVGADSPALPSWFDAAWLAGNQQHILDRSGEIRNRFLYSTLSSEQAAAELEPQQAELLELVQAAVPPMNSAVEQMTEATDLLSQQQLQLALEQEALASESLAQAIEIFADSRTLIDISLQTQQQLVLLNGPEQALPEQLAQLDINERQQIIAEDLQRNITRLARLQGALKRDQAKQSSQAQQGGEEALAQVEALFEEAERLRVLAATALDAANQGEVAQLAEAQEQLTALQKLFFNLVEHLQQLLSDQSTLRDKVTEQLSGEVTDMLERLPQLDAEQAEQQSRAEQIATALQEQADALAEQGDAERSEGLAQAYVEVGMAQRYMADARDLAAQAIEEAAMTTPDLEPLPEAQLQSAEHLAAALQALQPPQNNPEDGENQEQEEQMSRQEAERRLQAAREREAERAKNRQAAGGSEPVEKDW